MAETGGVLWGFDPGMSKPSYVLAVLVQPGPVDDPEVDGAAEIE